MKVLVVTHTFVSRDARILRQIEAFRGAGWDVELLDLDPPRREAGLRSWRVPMQRRRAGPLRYLWEYGVFAAWTTAWIAARLVRQPRPDLVYINSLPDLLALAAWPARLARVPIVLDVHDPMPELFEAKGRSSGTLRRVLELQERWSARFADAVITVHEPLAELLATRSPDVDYEIVMNVPDLADWPSGPPRDPTSRRLVFNGSIAYRYGLDDVVRAMALVGDDIPGLRLDLIGEGEDVERLLRLAADLGIGDRVAYVGAVPWRELPRHLADAWAGVNVPKPDGLGELSFSNKVVEWVALGLPVVAAPTRVLRRYFPDGTLLYLRGSGPEAVAEALLTLHAMPDDELEERLRRSREALERIAWPVQRERLLAVADRLVTGPRRRA